MSRDSHRVTNRPQVIGESVRLLDRNEHGFGLMLHASIRHRIHWAAGYGFLVGIIFSAIATFGALTGGRAAFESKSMTLSAIIAAYLVGCPIAGATVGALLPLSRTRIGAYSLGFLAGLPLTAAVLLALFGVRWEAGAWVGLFVWPIFVGGPSGLIWWHIFASEIKASEHKEIRRRRREAMKAFRRADHVEVIRLLEPIESELSFNDRRRLAKSRQAN